MEPQDYAAINLANWNSRVPFHEHGYALQSFREDPAHLSGVVRFDVPRLGSLAGLDIVHLQCHIGTDTLSLARLGARRVTGLDFSGAALDVARRLAHDCGTVIDYVESELYGALDALAGQRFDLVYTGIGALGWLPDVRRWAQVVASLLRPGGALFIREGHPVLWSMCDPREDGLLVIEYPYFETEAGTPFHETTTYVDHEGELASPATLQLNHGLAEILNAVWDAGMDVTLFEEHRSVPWNALGAAMVEDVDGGLGEFVLRDQPERMPLTYTLRAVKRSPDRLTA